MTDSHLENTLFQYNNSFLADERFYKKADHFDNIISFQILDRRKTICNAEQIVTFRFL